MLSKQIRNFNLGLITKLEAQSIADGAFSDVKNFISVGDKVELSRGSAIIGDEIAGTGTIPGLGIFQMSNGTYRIYQKVGAKLKYYNLSSGTWSEVGSNLFGSDAAEDDVLFAPYSSNAGEQLWFSTPNSGLFKIMLANPTDYSILTSDAHNYNGYISIKYNRMILWGRNEDKTGIYGSYIDKQAYTSVSAESISGSGATYTGTLAFKGGGSKRTCFGVSFTDGTETFTDNYDGTLTGNAGGSGTINYTTGVFSVTFNTAPVNPVTSDYQWEDSTDTGIADFTMSGSRTAGQGFVFRQDDGGPTKKVEFFNDIIWCFHEYKTWTIVLTEDDTNATNTPFREGTGIPSLRGAVATGEGIYYVDTSNFSKPVFRIMQLSSTSSEILPDPVSYNVDFSDYRFDQLAMEEWDDNIVFVCRYKDSVYNDTMFLWNRTFQLFNKRDFGMRCLAKYEGELWGGDSITNNIWKLFSGFDDQDAEVTGYLEGNISNLGLDTLKKQNYLVLEGEIQTDQKYTVSLNLDRSGWTEVGTVEGNADYVDKGQKIDVGATTIGSKEVGGGSSVVYGYHYKKFIRLKLDKFNEINYRIEPTGIGYMSITMIDFRDIRQRGNKLTKKYRA